MSDKFGLEKKLKRLHAAKKTMPKILGNMALNHFVKSFKDGGFTDKGFEKWQPRSRRAKRNTGRALLVDTGRLKRGLKLSKATFDFIKIADAVPYAATHNDGLRAGRGKGFKMPKRKFVGDSYVLKRNIKQEIVKQLNNVFIK